MHPHIRRQLAAALRSGTYKQVFGQLRTVEGFSAYGVLCDISLQGDWKRDADGLWSYLGAYGDPPSQVLLWAGVAHGPHGRFHLPRFTINDETSTIDFHNDAGVSFVDIANAIDFEETYIA